MKLSERIERVFLILERRESTHGARAWFARRARVTPWTVTRWINGERPFAGAPAGVLELLEEQAAAREAQP